VIVGLVGGLAFAVVIALGLSRGDSGGATLDTPGPSAIGGAIPTAGNTEGKTLPADTFDTFDGKTATFADFRGKPLVVNVWASSCAPCVKEMPSFEQVHRDLGDKVAIVGLNNQDRADKAQELATKTGVTYPLLRDPNGELFVDMQLAVMPTTLFVDTAGRVVYTRAGAMDATEIRELIDQKLGA
jgi:cytochrome c biogenesis protein CcmG, thiol:disulfide interchange protein DsbE